METRSRKKNIAKEMNIGALPKEALFDLLLLVEPHEIGVVCRSKNPRVRAICTSKLFQETYARKYPRKLMSGKLKYDYDVETGTHIFVDQVGNQVKIIADPRINANTIQVIQYIPFKQIYPSTYTTSEKDFVLTENILRRENPLNIILDVDDKSLYIGRERPYGAYTQTDYQKYVDSFQPEKKEFLSRIEMPNWYNNEDYKSSGKEFYNQIVKDLQDAKISRKPIWEFLKPIKF
jgi:hypothetical protein